MHTRNLIVGCGLSGAVLARVLAEANQDVLLVDEREHIGGNVYDYPSDLGITVQKYGPHVFHTDNEEVWRFLGRFTDWRPLVYRVSAVVGDSEIALPINLRSLGQLCAPAEAQRLGRKLVEAYGWGARISVLQLRRSAEADLAALAERIYSGIYANYTRKQWGMEPEELDPDVLARVPVVVSDTPGYFADKYCAVPCRGYTSLVRRLLAHPRIAVRCATPYEEIRARVSCETLFYSGSIDRFFDYRHGELPYRGASYEMRTFDREFYQSQPQLNYPDARPCSRSIEHKRFLGETSSRTIVSFERHEPFRQGVNHRCYPVPCTASRLLHRRYLAEAAARPEVVFFGRLGDYRYYNMDAAVARALALGRERS